MGLLFGPGKALAAHGSHDLDSPAGSGLSVTSVVVVVVVVVFVSLLGGVTAVVVVTVNVFSTILELAGHTQSFNPESNVAVPLHGKHLVLLLDGAKP